MRERGAICVCRQERMLDREIVFADDAIPTFGKAIKIGVERAGITIFDRYHTDMTIVNLRKNIIKRLIADCRQV